MRPALISGVTMLLTAVCAAPAVAAPVPLPEALESVTAACASTSSALTSVGGRAVDGDSSVAVTGDRFAVSGPGTNRVAIAGEGTFGAVADDGLRPKDRRAALRYIKRPGATWWLNPGAFWSPAAGWSATFDDESHFALQWDIRRNLVAERSSPDLFMQLGELAAKRESTQSKYLGAPL